MQQDKPGKQGTEAFQALLESVGRQLARLRTRLEALADGLEETGDLAGGETRKTLDELKTWLRLAIELEARIHAHQGAGRSRHGGEEIDIERARAAIGCRLARLRRCSGSGRLPE